MSLRSAWLFTALLVTALLFTRENSAQTPPAPTPADAPKPPTDAEKEQVRAFGSDGIKLYEAGKLEEAIVQFRKANAIYPTPQGTLYMARCHAKLGRLVRAREIYTDFTFQKAPPNASQNARDAHAVAEAELENLRARIPTLTIVLVGTLPPDAEVSLDGVILPAAELASKDVDPGTHTIVAKRKSVLSSAASKTSAGSELVVERSVTLAESQRLHIELELRPARRNEPPAPEQPTAIPGGSPAPDPVSNEPGGATPPGAGSRTLPIVAFATGTLSLGVGIATGITALGKAGDLKARCPAKRCAPEDEAVARDAHTLATISTVGFMAGGLAVGAGALLLIVRKPAPNLAVSSIQVRAGVASLEVAGTF